MDGLDRIPWKSLNHAYGSAEDVPELLRALKTAPSDLRGEESPWDATDGLNSPLLHAVGPDWEEVVTSLIIKIEN